MAKLRCPAKSAGGGEVVFFDLYSAVADIVTCAYGANTITYTTDSSGHVSAVLPTGAVTFTSSIAKDPSNLSNAYSKTINITSNTTEVRVMPDGALYWYGFGASNLQNVTTGNGWSASGWPSANPTYNTNYIALVTSGTTFTGVASANAYASLSKVHTITNRTGSGAEASMQVRASTDKAMHGGTAATALISSGLGHYVLTNDVITGSANAIIYTQRASNTDVYAIWCEE